MLGTTDPANEPDRALLRVQDLSVEFATSRGPVSAARNVTFEIRRGEVLGLVGESGCGKSTVARSLVRVLPPGASMIGGRVLFEGLDVRTLSPRALRRIRGSGIGIIFQDPLTGFDPLLTIGSQISETLRAHESLSRAEARSQTIELLRTVEIPAPERRYGAYPHELSGGMRQRAMIAMAISCRPRLLIADEPTTALDVTIQAQIVELLKRLQDELAMAILLVSHDLGLIASIADRVLVMYAGQTVEHGSAGGVLASPLHPYTESLIRSVVRIDGPRVSRLPSISGAPPRLGRVVNACPFGPRCKLHEAKCDLRNPPLAAVQPGRLVACDVVAGGKQGIDA
jgi:oligopeptide/dipeptide ABC transporter ATP-binding protein